MRDEYRAGMDQISYEQSFQRRLIDRLVEEADRQEQKTPRQAWLAIGLGVISVISALVWLFGSEED